MDFPHWVAYAIIVGAPPARKVSPRLIRPRRPGPGFDRSGRGSLCILLPTLIPPGGPCGGGVALWSTCSRTAALWSWFRPWQAGCKAVVPCVQIEQAKAIAASLPAGSALLAGERLGPVDPGFRRRQLPGRGCAREVCGGKTVVLTTTSGTRAASWPALRPKHVYIASFANLRASSDEISVQFFKKDHCRSVHIICAGTDGHISLEDSILAGALTSKVAEISDVIPGSEVAKLFGNDEALMVVC